MTLDKLRLQIDEIDKDILALLDLRSETVIEIGKVKRATGEATIDREREKYIVDYLTRRLRLFPEPALREIYRQIFAAMVELQLVTDENSALWTVGQVGAKTFALKDGERILLAVSSDEVERLNAIRDLHNAQINRVRDYERRAT